MYLECVKIQHEWMLSINVKTAKITGLYLNFVIQFYFNTQEENILLNFEEEKNIKFFFSYFDCANWIAVSYARFAMSTTWLRSHSPPTRIIQVMH